MEQGTVLDRRSFRDRRMGDAFAYTGPERRKFIDRRSERATVCIVCGKSCGDQRGWIQGSYTREDAAKYLIDICMDCYSKQVSKFSTGNR